MGEIVATYPVRSAPKQRVIRLRLFFDSGSWGSFLKLSVARKLGPVMTLPEPVGFSGFWNGKFRSSHIAHIEVKILGVWCRHFAYVVPDGFLSEGEDALIGHDFMQGYDIRLHPRRKIIVADRLALRRAFLVR